jgi:predicted permease
MLTRLLNLFRRRRMDADLDTELRFHLDSLEAEHRARGLSPEAARRAARRDFGAIARIQEAHREHRGLPVIETLWRDVRFGLRSMRRTPAVTLAVIATLAIGIGANTAIFSVVNGVLLKPLPYPHPDRLVSVAHSARLLSAPFLYFIEREQNQAFEQVGAYNVNTASVTGSGEPEQARILIATAEVLPALGVQPLLGRYFSALDDVPGSANTVVLTHGYWQRRFGGDPAAVGRSLTIDGQAWTVVGVMPPRFVFLDYKVDLIIPFRLDRAQVRVGNFFLASLARLKPEVTLDQASADIARLIPIAVDSFPLIPGFTRDQMRRASLTPVLRPLKQTIVGDAGNTLWVLLGSIGIVLLIACANVANLILVRTEGRQQELSIRAALGAGWPRIARELLTESAVLSFTGGLLGIGVAYAAVRVLRSIAPANLPRLDEIAVDSNVLMFALALSALSGLLFGILPALRYASPHVGPALRAAARTSGLSRERLRIRGVLVVVQVALALVLLVCAGLMIRTFQKLNQVDPGFSDAGQVQTVRITIPFASVRDPALTARRQTGILTRIAAIPGVTSAAFSSAIPMGATFAMTDLLFPEGRVLTPGDAPKPRHFRFISPEFFGTMQIRILAGRDLTWTDIFERRPVALVSENLAWAEWGGPRQALGKRFRGSSAADQWREIVGVVADVRATALGAAAEEAAYFPVLLERMYDQPIYVWRMLTYAIRTPRAGTPDFLDELRRAVWSVDPSLPLVDVRTMGDILDDSLARTSFTLVMLAIAGSMALLLGIIGIYAVISYAVSQRTREVGIRIALGANAATVRGMFVRQGLILASAGVAAGLGGAAALTRWMASLLFGVGPLDPGTYAAVSAILILAAALACYLPSRRATRVDPIEALRTE